ncbi:MAG: carotenoid biosynthesis protein, partial [Candidatus Thorarchaeota archaeon]|nr:carotenoid biosynthesis protein [Candidatus Thorarchaeota archaeon]
PWKKGLGLLLAFSILPLVVESIGISTGLPYGEFYYSDQLGFKVFGLVPWSVAFAFAPLVLGAMASASQFTSDVRILLPFSALLLVVFDLILDPAMVALGVWIWVEPGPYYGIPTTNYLGWFLTALIASGLMYLIAKAEISMEPRIDFRIAASLLLTLFFWTGYNVWTSLWIPAIVGGIMIVLMLFLLEKKYN